MITEKTIFVTSDGTEWKNKQEAEKHQTMLNLIEAFRQYQAGRPGGMGPSGFFDFLKRNHKTVQDYIRMTYGEDE